MPFKIIRDDIVNCKTDVIVNAANFQLAEGNGVDGSIHKAAGEKELKEACSKIGHCDVGDVVLTPGFKLNCRWIFHTVGPCWTGGNKNEEDLLRSCYRKCLELAVKKNAASIAFPLISAGAYRYPVEEALLIAVNEIQKFLLKNKLDVELVLLDKNAFNSAGKIVFGIENKLTEKATLEIGAHNLSAEKDNQNEMFANSNFEKLYLKFKTEKNPPDMDLRSGINSDKCSQLVRKNSRTKLDVLQIAVRLTLNFEETKQFLSASDLDAKKFSGLEEIYINHIKKSEWDINKWKD